VSQGLSLKIFSLKNLAFFAETTDIFWKKIDHNVGFWEKRHFFAEKSQKFVIITSTPEAGCLKKDIPHPLGRP
jgi:hypothetical protein